jgi:hypothetical protein
MRRRKRRFLGALAGLAVLAGAGCTSSVFVPTDQRAVVDPKTDGNYQVTGFALGRYWSTRLLYGVPLGPNHAKSAFRSVQSAAVDGEIVDLGLHVENYTVNPGAYCAHYGGFLPFFLGTKCYYLSAVFAQPNPSAPGKQP